MRGGEGRAGKKREVERREEGMDTGREGERGEKKRGEGEVASSGVSRGRSH